VGGAIASPTALSLIATNFEEGAPRNKAMGVYAAMSGAGGAVGLLAGGLLTDLVSWRWVLFVNVPIGVLVLLAAPRVLREGERIRGRLDWPGAVTVTAGMALLVYGLTNASTHSWGSTGTVAALVASGVSLVAFVAVQIRSDHALMPLRILTNRDRSGSYVTMLFIGAALFAAFFFITLFFQEVKGYSPLRAGLYFLPFAVIIGVAAQLSSMVVGRLGPRVLVPVGTALAAGGLWWLGTVSTATTYLALLAPLALLGVGMGIAFVPLTLTALAGVRGDESGLASALLNTGQQIGGAVGLAALSTIAVTAAKAALRSSAAAHRGLVTPHLAAVATTHGYTRAFLVGAAIAAGAAVVSLVTIRVGRDPEPVTVPGGA
ncbi:MAG: MFS transporter, partial [Acidimicrobiales bacterium]